MNRTIDYLIDRFLYRISDWDWTAVIISLVSLGIAIASMVFAKKTLKSQKQTEINTTPIIKPSIQEFLLREIFVKVFDGYLRLTAIKHVYDNEQYKVYLSEEKLLDLKIDTSIIHVELFYSDEERYRCLQGLLNMVKAFNSRIDVCIDHFKNPNITSSLLKNEVSELIGKILNIVFVWDSVMTLVYGYNVINKREVLDAIIKRMAPAVKSKKTMEEYYDNDNVFTYFYDSIEQKTKILSFMNIYTTQVTDDFSGLLIVRQ